MDYTDIVGRTPLQLAVANEHLEVCPFVNLKYVATLATNINLLIKKDKNVDIIYQC